MKIITIVGARPQFIKAAVVSREIAKHPHIQEIIVHTGQHFDVNMSDVFFDEMDIPKPIYNLNINGVNHGEMTGLMLTGIEKILIQEKPDWVLVYGDTNSTMAGALAAKKLHIKLAHVEAGLRSYNMNMPEEINRILTDRISDILFCPTEAAVNNLVNEGFLTFNSRIINCGDVMYDGALYYSSKSKFKSSIVTDLGYEKYVLATIHRAENTDDLSRLISITEAFNSINSEITIIVPLHPRTRKIIENNNIKCDFKIIDPIGYFDMIELIRNSQFVMTDSGGLQKEAYFFKKYCLTLRDETEWMELVNNGFNFLVGANKSIIIGAVSNLKKDFIVSTNLFGDGNASKVIIDALLDYNSN